MSDSPITNDIIVEMEQALAKAVQQEFHQAVSLRNYYDAVCMLDAAIALSSRNINALGGALIDYTGNVDGGVGS